MQCSSQHKLLFPRINQPFAPVVAGLLLLQSRVMYCSGRALYHLSSDHLRKRSRSYQAVTKLLYSIMSILLLRFERSLASFRITQLALVASSADRNTNSLVVTSYVKTALKCLPSESRR
jgi:hypothetical protein